MVRGYLVAGAIALGFLFIFRSKIQPVHAQIPIFIQPTPASQTTNLDTFGAQNLITVLD
jgi:hypothetical protein